MLHLVTQEIAYFDTVKVISENMDRIDSMNLDFIDDSNYCMQSTFEKNNISVVKKEE